MAFNKLEKEKQKLVSEKCQSILVTLLRDEDNKYCVDCDAKGPRWASWNLGIFLCIRCAGIHRNLGVHISRVKSVNLDAWTPEQIACIQNMGNSKARAVYEANLPDNFRRPQTDSSLEAFVRAKYEQKKYIAKEWVEPPPPKPAFDIEEELRKEKEKKRNKNKSFQSSGTVGDIQANPLPRPSNSNSTLVTTAINAEKIVQKTENGKTSDDLLGLDMNSTANARPDDDSFGLFVSSLPSKETNCEIKAESKATSNEESDFFNQKAPTDDKKVMSKESILSLYGSAPPPSLPPTQQPIGSQSTQFNGLNSSLFMGQFGPNSQPMASQTPNPMFVSQNTGIDPLQAPMGQTSNLMSQSNFPLTTNPFLANTSKGSNFGQQTVQQLPQHMATLQLNPMPASNPNTNPIPNNNWFQMGPQSTGLPVPQPGGINPFMTGAPIPAGVPFGNNFGSAGLNSGSMFPQTDNSGSQWAFNGNQTLNQSSGVTASTNLWQ
ncbi:unnamed protein product [Medioppia subpectinata]|uniref:Arf-GAP domain-containing protein n=1 Tax=Medioppia subpectinata TaxID=1979941 RepID=A0A7R9PUC5_9ACAR|nr:unnamed protein product [Medioppia subpectinata]CAG2101423.1 unnamed protein product [Medioppia subpectinata]